MLKATSVPQTPLTNHSQYSSPVEALNLSPLSSIIRRTIEFHVPSRRKKSLQSYSDLLALMRFDMTFDVTLRGDSSFGKLTKTSHHFYW